MAPAQDGVRRRASSAARTRPGPSTDGLDEETRTIVEGLYGDGIVARRGALSTQLESGLGFDHQMFPDRAEWPRHEAASVHKLPQQGDVWARSALTVHRGTANRSALARPVVVLGVDAPGAGHDALHDLMVTQAFHDALPPELERHLHPRVVDELVPIVQKHTIEGLVMGEA